VGISTRQLDHMTLIGISIPFLDGDLPIEEFAHGSWVRSGSVRISEYWNAEPAAATQGFEARSQWSHRHLYFRFETSRSEELIINSEPQTERKTLGLWERDVCEVFIAPDPAEPRRYFEFEVAPTGEWLDLAIDMTSGERVTDTEYDSGLKAAALIEEDRVVMALKIPWEAFGKKPQPGDIWLGNIFRCVGREPDRGYLAWRPTMTEKPNFHVPERFGQLIFDN
jgi:hypothetical protein